MIEHLPGFAPLADRYDGFVLDLWGVIHDGINAFPQAVETLGRLRNAVLFIADRNQGRHSGRHLRSRHTMQVCVHPVQSGRIGR